MEPKLEPGNQPKIDISLPKAPHPDDVRMALEIAKGAGQTPFELALRRMATNPDPFLVKAALASCEGLGEEYRLSILAQTYENLATEYEKSSRIKEGMEARQMAEKLREEVKKINQNKPQENQ
jgi:hypothetical protein